MRVNRVNHSYMRFNYLSQVIHETKVWNSVNPEVFISVTISYLLNFDSMILFDRCLCVAIFVLNFLTII